MNTSLYPLWKQAVKTLVDLDPQPGHIVKKQWLNKHFDLEEGSTKEQYQSYQMQFMKAMSEFRRELLEEHQIALATLPGVGYKILHPREQTGYALTVGMKRLASDIVQMGAMVGNIDASRLTGDEKRENSEARARLSMLAGMVEKTAKLPLSKRFLLE